MRTNERREALLRDRQRGLGGTDMARIFGVHPSGEDALDVFYEKTRPIKEDGQVVPPTIHQLRGIVSEDTIAALYFEKTGRQGRKAPRVFTHPEFPAFRCHLDYSIFADPKREPEWTRGTGVLELKAPIASVFGRIADHGMRLSETIQLHTYIGVSRRSWGGFGFGNLEHSAGPVLVVDVRSDPDLEDFILRTGQRFYDECILPGIPPDPEQWKILDDPDSPPILERTGDLEVVDDEEAVRLGLAVLEAAELKKRGEDLYSEASSRMKKWMEEREDRTDRIEIPKTAKFTIVRQDGRKSFREDTLREARPIDRDKLVRWITDYYLPDGEEGAARLMPVPNVEGKDYPAFVTPLEFLELMSLDLDLFVRRGDPFSFLKPTDKRPSKERTDV